MFPFVFVVIAFWVTVLGGGFYLVRRYIRAVEHRGKDEIDLAELRTRIIALEDALETTRSDVERLEAGQEFTSRLLSARPGNIERTT